MAYTNNDGADPTKPDGATTLASTIDTEIQKVKLAYNERLNVAFGGTWSTSTEADLSKVGTAATFYGTGKQAVQTVVDLGNITGTVALDFDTRGNYVKATLTGNVTFTVANMRTGTTYVLMLVQDATGGRTVTFPSTIRTSSSISLPVVTTASLMSIYSIVPWTSTIATAILGGTGINVS
jgi:hypothetical protein